MAAVSIYLKGWRDSRLYVDAVNRDDHPLHDAAWPVHLNSFRKYEAGEFVYLTVEYTTNLQDDHRIAEDAFERFNIGDPATDEVVARYRGAGNRSLSVGDVVVIDGVAYACASFGFEELDEFTPVEFTPPS